MIDGLTPANPVRAQHYHSAPAGDIDRESLVLPILDIFFFLFRGFGPMATLLLRAGYENKKIRG